MDIFLATCNIYPAGFPYTKEDTTSESDLSILIISTALTTQELW